MSLFKLLVTSRAYAQAGLSNRFVRLSLSLSSVIKNSSNGQFRGYNNS